MAGCLKNFILKRQGRLSRSHVRSMMGQTVLNYVPTKAYEALINILEDIELNALAHAHQNGPMISVNLDDL